MPPMKLEQNQTTRNPQLLYELGQGPRPASEARSSSTEVQDAADSLNDGARSLQGMSTEIGLDNVSPSSSGMASLMLLCVSGS